MVHNLSLCKRKDSFDFHVVNQIVLAKMLQALEGVVISKPKNLFPFP